MRRDPSPMQARVLFHCERVFRSTGAGMKAHALFLDAATAAVGWERARDATSWNRGECLALLALIEWAARAKGLHVFRDVRCITPDLERLPC